MIEKTIKKIIKLGFIKNQFSFDDNINKTNNDTIYLKKIKLNKFKLIINYIKNITFFKKRYIIYEYYPSKDKKFHGEYNSETEALKYILEFFKEEKIFEKEFIKKSNSFKNEDEIKDKSKKEIEFFEFLNGLINIDKIEKDHIELGIEHFYFNHFSNDNSKFGLFLKKCKDINLSISYISYLLNLSENEIIKHFNKIEKTSEEVDDKIDNSPEEIDYKKNLETLKRNLFLKYKE